MSTTVRRVDGYAITTPTPGNTVRRVDGYVLFEVFPSTQVRHITAYGLLSNRNTIPSNKPAMQAIVDLINRISKDNWTVDNITITEPEAVIDPKGNTQITVSDPRNRYLGTQDLVYTRKDIVDSFVDIEVSHADTIHELLTELSEVTGIALSTLDIEDGPIQQAATTVELEASVSSYFFIPGTTVSITLV